MRKSYTLLALLLCLSGSAVVHAQYIADFENTIKNDYSPGTVTLSGLQWGLNWVRIDNISDTDSFKNGLRSARLRGTVPTSLTMLADKTGGLGTISFEYRRVATDTLQYAWRVEYSTDGGMTWALAGAPFTATDAVQTFSATVNTLGASRIRIKRHTAMEGNAPRQLNIDDITLTDYSLVPPFAYRSIQSGTWADAATWERSDDGGATWAAALAGPTHVDDAITVRAGHTVTVADSLVIDQVVVASGGTLVFDDVPITIHNGIGVDLDVQGTWQDNTANPNRFTFASGASWRLGSAATFIKTSNSAPAKYGDNYHGGMASIPTTAHWILRKIGTLTPTLATNNSYYPNLTFESFSGSWNPGGNRGFAGVGNPATIYGNLDIGGTGTMPLFLTNTNTNASPITVLGNLHVRSLGILSNEDTGTGFDVQGNVTLDGITFLSGGGLLRLSGDKGQTISGTGTANISELAINKSADEVTLLRSLTVNDTLTLSNGHLALGSEILTLADGAAIVGGTAASHIITNGTGSLLIQGVTSAGRTFPVGISASSYDPAELAPTTTTDIAVRVGGTFSNAVADAAKTVLREWNITPVVPSSTSMALTHDASLMPPAGTAVLGHFNTTASEWTEITAAYISSFRTYAATVSDFSPFGGGVQGGFVAAPLPISLLSFEATPKDGSVLLNWRTTSEHNNAYMAVERSANGTDFDEIGRVTGAGTTTAPQHYSLTDARPLAALSYYRLRQVDYDGTAEYHKVVAVDMGTLSGGTRLFPVPAQDLLGVQMTTGVSHAAEVQVLNMQGQLLLRAVWPAGASTLELDISSLPAGAYYLRGADGQVSRFVKG